MKTIMDDTEEEKWKKISLLEREAEFWENVASRPAMYIGEPDNIYAALALTWGADIHSFVKEGENYLVRNDTRSFYDTILKRRGLKSGGALGFWNVLLERGTPKDEIVREIFLIEADICRERARKLYLPIRMITFDDALLVRYDQTDHFSHSQLLFEMNLKIHTPYARREPTQVRHLAKIEVSYQHEKMPKLSLPARVLRGSIKQPGKKPRSTLTLPIGHNRDHELLLDLEQSTSNLSLTMRLTGIPTIELVGLPIRT